jgi:hypothetical protein
VRIGDDLERPGHGPLATLRVHSLALVLMHHHMNLNVQLHGQTGEARDRVCLLCVIILGDAQPCVPA